MAERRREFRQRALRSGRIVFNSRRSVIDCVVRNLSDGGACLQVNGVGGIPVIFDLIVDGIEPDFACQMIWASETRIGVEFGIAATERGPAQTPHAADAEAENHSGAQRETIYRSELLTLSAALDKVPIGIILLDSNSRAQFINRAFRKMWRLPDAVADTKPPLIALMYHGRDTRAYAVPVEELDAYVSARVAHVKAGDPKPLDLRLANGEVIRMQCTVLPNGGRMLCYTFVSDIVRHADELGALRAALNGMQQGIILLDPMLNAQFMNRAVRHLWRVSDEQAERRPSYIELVSGAQETGVFGVPPELLADYIANRVAIARAGDPTPLDIPHGDGRVIRSQCAELPGGGRMLTYTDVTDLVHRAAQFEELATIDGLTGVYNRRQFNALALAEWSRFQRYYRPLSVLILDIDHFKQINDRFGHDAGDRTIIHVANLCTEAKRNSDIVARLGGDEFVVLLPETSLAQARTFADRLREMICRCHLPQYEETGAEIFVEVSVGIAEAALSMPSIDALIQAADQCLYRAKAAGRNRTIAPPDATAVDHRAAAE